MIIYTHGGSNPADLTNAKYVYPGDNILENIRKLFKEPCVVLAAGNYGDQPFQSEGEVALTPELKQNAYRDILTAINYIKGKSYVDRTKIILLGESRGSYNIIRVLETLNDVKIAAVWAVPGTKSWVSPDLLNEVYKITTPLYHLHAVDDNLVFINDGRLFRDKLHSISGPGNQQYTYEELPAGGHPGNYSDTFTTDAVWMEKTFEYFKNNK